MLTVLGIVLIVLAMRDVRHELFHPERSGTLTRLVSRIVWTVSRAIAIRHRPVLCLAGPLMLIAIGATWVILVAIGAALINLAHLPHDFAIDPALPDAARRGFMTALYTSMGMLTSAGVPDITPKTTPMRLLAMVEPTVGLIIITAWITWVLSICSATSAMCISASGRRQSACWTRWHATI